MHLVLVIKFHPLPFTSKLKKKYVQLALHT